MGAVNEIPNSLLPPRLRGLFHACVQRKLAAGGYRAGRPSQFSESERRVLSRGAAVERRVPLSRFPGREDGDRSARNRRTFASAGGGVGGRRWNAVHQHSAAWNVGAERRGGG